MSDVIAVVSGKGGTGKTSICAALACCLAAEGHTVMCIDADIGLRNLDIALGMAECAAISFTEVMSGSYSLHDAAKHPRLKNLRLLTAPIRAKEEEIDLEQFGKLVQTIQSEFDFCLIDAPAGVGVGFELAAKYAHRVLVISNSDPASMRDATRTAELLTLANKQDIQLIVNRVQPKMFSRMQMTVDDIMDSVGLPLIGVVPEDADVVLTAAAGEALVLASQSSASVACRNISRRIRGVQTPLMKL